MRSRSRSTTMVSPSPPSSSNLTSPISPCSIIALASISSLALCRTNCAREFWSSSRCAKRNFRSNSFVEETPSCDGPLTITKRFGGGGTFLMTTLGTTTLGTTTLGTTTFFATTFFAGAFLATTFLATTFLTGAFFATTFFAGAFLATTFLAGAFLATTFLATTFLAGTFLATTFLAGAFLATTFLAGAFFLVISSSSGYPKHTRICGGKRLEGFEPKSACNPHQYADHVAFYRDFTCSLLIPQQFCCQSLRHHECNKGANLGLDHGIRCHR